MRNCWLSDDFKLNPACGEQLNENGKWNGRIRTGLPVRVLVLVLPSWDWLSKLNFACSVWTFHNVLHNPVAAKSKASVYCDKVIVLQADGETRNQEISGSVPSSDLGHGVVELSRTSLTSGAATCLSTRCSWKHTHLFRLTQRTTENKIYCVWRLWKKQQRTVFSLVSETQVILAVATLNCFRVFSSNHIMIVFHLSNLNNNCQIVMFFCTI